ncbi:hypothetical protein OF001_U40156 [Pseudomonas sp. OF001]|nr:hypothetical protein OF001_U40156 [Pseudomonas sp. OF001]
MMDCVLLVHNRLTNFVTQSLSTRRGLRFSQDAPPPRNCRDPSPLPAPLEPDGHPLQHACLRLRGGNRQLHRRRCTPGPDHLLRVARGRRPGNPPAHPPAAPHHAAHRPHRGRPALPAPLPADPRRDRRGRGRGRRRPCAAGRQPPPARHAGHRPALPDPGGGRLQRAVPRGQLRPDPQQPHPRHPRRGLRRLGDHRARTARLGADLQAAGHHLQRAVRRTRLPGPARRARAARRPAAPPLPAPGLPGDEPRQVAARRPRRPGAGHRRPQPLPGQHRRGHDRGAARRHGHRRAAGVLGAAQPAGRQPGARAARAHPVSAGGLCALSVAPVPGRQDPHLGGIPARAPAGAPGRRRAAAARLQPREQAHGRADTKSYSPGLSHPRAAVLVGGRICRRHRSPVHAFASCPRHRPARRPGAAHPGAGPGLRP